ncbi:MAG: biotin--[acetyl-CoA-carboxylase] ligase [Phycisphaerales bacterium]|nr:biotin--[acetyl-CoA-carboxylase] ligase [Phycisphaerales bacterium]MCB9836584.1 biotin--[acetyl-CoA-carboxylase] ligase [Phycisphaera sp.]
MTTDRTPLHRWADELETHISGLAGLGLDRVVVIAETSSTQDAAARHAGGKPGLICITGRQTGGRGRLGRHWLDNKGLGIAMTLALRTDAVDGRLPLAAGLAVAEAIATPELTHRIGLRWPNDVVDRVTGKKVAGILIEQQDGLTLLGIGINTHHVEADWQSAELETAISLRELGLGVDRLELTSLVLTQLNAALYESPDVLAKSWHARDTLTGTWQRFEHNGRRYEGIVESIDPSSTLVVRTTMGLARLPALTTSLVHD